MKSIELKEKTAAKIAAAQHFLEKGLTITAGAPLSECTFCHLASRQKPHTRHQCEGVLRSRAIHQVSEDRS